MRLIILLIFLVSSASAQITNYVTNYAIINLATNNPSSATANNVSEFTSGLETGSGLAAVLLGIIAVRRALALGDGWSD